MGERGRRRFGSVESEHSKYTIFTQQKHFILLDGWMVCLCIWKLGKFTRWEQMFVHFSRHCQHFIINAILTVERKEMLFYMYCVRATREHITSHLYGSGVHSLHSHPLFIISIHFISLELDSPIPSLSHAFVNMCFSLLHAIIHLTSIWSSFFFLE